MARPGRRSLLPAADEPKLRAFVVAHRPTTDGVMDWLHARTGNDYSRQGARALLLRLGCRQPHSSLRGSTPRWSVPS